MRRTAIISAVLVGALVAAPAPGAWAQTADVSGRIDHIEPGSRTLYFHDGRIVTLGPDATLWIDGREIPIETLRRGMNVVVRDESGATKETTGQPSRAAAARPQHPPVSASGTVARVDADNRVVTFQDGRSLKLGAQGQVWEASKLDDVRPGEEVLLQNAQPAGYAAMGQVAPERMRMGRVIHVDPVRSMVLLDNGAWVRMSPRTRMRMDGREARQTQIVPGDELIIVITEPQPSAGPPSAETPSAMAGSRTGQPSRPQADDATPSAMPRTERVEQGEAVQADEVHIFRRRQSP